MAKESVPEVPQKGAADMATKRTQDDPTFTCNVVMARFQRETTLEEVCRTFEVSSSMDQQRGPAIVCEQRRRAELTQSPQR